MYVTNEGMQAGLSWSTILNKRSITSGLLYRESMREAFDGFEASKIIKWDAKKVAALLNNPGIIRNRLKVAAVQS